MKVSKRIIMIVVVLSVSAFVVEIECNVIIHNNYKKYNNQKNVHNWLICSNELEMPKEKSIVKILKKNGINDYSIYNSNSQIRITQLDRVKVSRKNDDKYCDQNVAYLNTKYKELAYKIKGIEYVNYAGEKYRIIGSYTDDKDAALEEVMFYISSESNGIKNIKLFDCIEIKSKKYIEKKIIKRIGKKIYGDASVNEDKIYTNNIIDFSRFAFLLLMILGFFVVFNAIGFVQDWIYSQKSEMKIRRMVGYTKKRIVIILYKRFFVLCGISVVIGTIISNVAINLLRNNSDLVATRNLIGINLHSEAVVLGSVLLFLCGSLLVGVNMVFGNKKSRLSEKRGEY